MNPNPPTLMLLRTVAPKTKAKTLLKCCLYKQKDVLLHTSKAVTIRRPWSSIENR